MLILFHYHELALHLSWTGKWKLYFLVEDAEPEIRLFFNCVVYSCGRFLVFTIGNFPLFLSTYLIPLSFSLPTSMARGWTFTAVGLTVLIALVLVHPTSCATTAMVNHTCPASSCGNIYNISFPFRLKSDPENCGDPWYELSCENNRTVLQLYDGKFYVEEISYNNYTIQIVDSGIQKNNYFSTPNYSLYRYNFSWEYSYTTSAKGDGPGSRTITEFGLDELWKTSEFSIVFGHFYLQL